MGKLRKLFFKALHFYLDADFPNGISQKTIIWEIAGRRYIRPTGELGDDI
jgi:hypothetical protein